MTDISYTVYEISTGIVVGYGTGQPLLEDGQDFVEGHFPPNRYRIVNGEPIDLGPPPPNLSRLKDEARTVVVSYLNGKSSEISGIVPENERSTWDAKEAAALAVSPTPKQQKMLEIEAALVGETVEVVRQKILTNAALFYIMGPAVCGIRRKITKLIDTAETPEAVEAALSKMEVLWGAIVTDPLAFNENPTQFLNTLEG